MAFANKIGNLFKQAISSNPSVYQALRCMSSSKVFVGGISYNTDDHSLREAFTDFGEVVEARVIMDRETGRSRGFAFVTFASSDEASSAISGMDGKDLHGRVVRVSPATERAGGFRSGGGGYGGGGYGGGGYSGGGDGGYGGGGGNYGGDSYNSGGGGNYGGDSYNSGGGGGGGYGGRGGGRGDGFVSGTAGESYASSGNAGGYGGSGAVGYGGGGDQYDSNLGSSSSSSSKVGGYDDGSQDDLLGGDFKDDDEPDSYANKRG